MQDFTVFRALGLSFQSWFRNFIPFTLLTGVLFSPVIIYILQYDPSSASSIDGMVKGMFMYPIYILIATSTLLPPMLVYKVVQDLNGQKSSFFTSIKFGLRGVLPALILAVINIILGNIPLGGIVGAVLACIWFVASPAAVAEKLSNPFSAMSRSAVLTSGRRWGIFGLTFLIGIVQIAILFIFIAPLFSDHADQLETSWRAMAVKVAITMGVFYMFTGITQAVSYVLLRQDKEGIGNDDLAKIFE